MAELSYHAKMAQEAQIRARVVHDGRAAGDGAGRGVVYADPSRRREVESFAAKLRGVEPPGAPPDPERMEYARMDASAMLWRMSGGNEQVVDALQAAILNQDMASFVDILDSNNIGNKVDRNNLRHFIAKQDREAIAACMRMISRGTEGDGGFQREELGQVDVGLERVNYTDPIAGHNRRNTCTMFLKNTNVHDPLPFRRPANTKVKPETLSVIELGEAADDWERQLQFHTYMLDTANSAMNLREEAEGTGMLDGRLSGQGSHPGWNNWGGDSDWMKTYSGILGAGAGGSLGRDQSPWMMR